jgi:hypothetical protein
MSRFVRPDTAILKISHGDTLTVKRRLNAGEHRARFARMSLAGVDGTLNVNRLQIGLATITAYLLDWSLTTDDGAPVVIREVSLDHLTSTLDGLDPESFTEIREAIEAHEIAMDAARTAEKNDQDGKSESPAISPSPSGAAGASSGSGS